MDGKLKFRDKLKRWAKEIKRDAKGNTCNLCQHYTPGNCLNEFNVIDGSNLYIMKEDAPACPSFVSLAVVACQH